MRKGIFIDLDGTVMRKDLTISGLNCEAILEAIKSEYQVVFVSGRPFGFVEYLASKINKEIDVIGFNGGYSSGLIDYALSTEVVRDIYEICSQEHLNAIFKSIDHIYANKGIISNFVYPISDHEKVLYTENCTKEQLGNTKIYKILGLYNNNDEIINEKLAGLDITKSYYTGKGFELTNKHANKGKAIELYCLKHEISIKDSYMFGDGVNDESMFLLGGNNMVMGNASQEIKKYATSICEDCYADGVGKMILKILEENSND